MERESILESKIEVLEKKLADKEREFKAERLIWAIKEDQMRDNFTRCKQAAEYWQKKALEKML